MKKFLILISVLGFFHFSYALKPAADMLLKYEGQTISVCAKVQSTYTSSGKSKTVFLNFGKPFPDHTISIVIFNKDLKNFTYDSAKHLQDKKVCVTGEVKIYKGKPEMIISGEEYIRIQ